MQTNGRKREMEWSGRPKICLCSTAEKTDPMLSIQLCNRYEHHVLNCCGHGNTSAAKCLSVFQRIILENGKRNRKCGWSG